MSISSIYESRPQASFINSGINKDCDPVAHIIHRYFYIIVKWWLSYLQVSFMLTTTLELW